MFPSGFVENWTGIGIATEFEIETAAGSNIVDTVDVAGVGTAGNVGLIVVDHLKVM